MKKCWVCKETKFKEADFYPNQNRCKLCHKDYMRNYYREHPEKRYKHVTSRRTKVKYEIFKYKESKGCLDCKKFYPHYILQFDHLKDKKFTISHKIGQVAMKTMWEEIAKCDVVCANCHAERTHQRLQI